MNLTQMTIMSTTAGKNPSKKGSSHHGQQKSPKCSTWMQSQKRQNVEKEMATHSSVLAWRIPGTVEPGWLLSMGSHRVGHNCTNLAAAGDDASFYSGEQVSAGML